MRPCQKAPTSACSAGPAIAVCLLVDVSGGVFERDRSQVTGTARKLFPVRRAADRWPRLGGRSSRAAQSEHTSANERAVCSDNEPEAAKLRDVLAEDLPRLLVALVVVERTSGIRRL